MLTATYSLVAIANEQSKIRRLLHRVQQCIRNAWNSLHEVEPACIESAFNDLTRLDDYCHGRKVEIYLIPAVRSATDEANPLLAELEALSAMGMNILRSVGEQLGHALREGGASVAEICGSLELYCHKLLKRLAKEEQELVPLVRRVFSIEEWFAIGAKFLSEDGQVCGMKRCSTPPVLVTPAAC
jgi:hemerythrin-like domain-containing protein